MGFNFQSTIVEDFENRFLKKKLYESSIGLAIKRDVVACAPLKGGKIGEW
jgi:hypothetical protein